MGHAGGYVRGRGVLFQQDLGLLEAINALEVLLQLPQLHPGHGGLDYLLILRPAGAFGVVGVVAGDGSGSRRGSTGIKLFPKYES